MKELLKKIGRLEEELGKLNHDFNEKCHDCDHLTRVMKESVLKCTTLTEDCAHVTKHKCEVESKNKILLTTQGCLRKTIYDFE